MKFKKYPENKPTKSGDYLCKHPVLLGDGDIVYYYSVETWSSKWDEWNCNDMHDDIDKAMQYAIRSIDGWAEIVDEGYED